MNLLSFARHLHQYYGIRALHDLWSVCRDHPEHKRALLRRHYHRLWPIMRTVACTYRRLAIPRKRIVVVVGSMGKTTTTRAIRTVLGISHRGQVPGNDSSTLAENLLRSHREDEVDAIEAGIAKPGQMASYASMLKPDCVVVTSIKSDHNRSFPTLTDTREEKVKMVENLTGNGLAMLNGDDPNVMWMATQTRSRVMTYGLDPSFDVWASEVSLDWPRGTTFTLHVGDVQCLVKTNLLSDVMLYPALAAACVGLTEGVSLDVIARRLGSVCPPRGRMEHVSLDDGTAILNDCHKGALETYDAALAILARIPADKRIFVVGGVQEPPGPQTAIYRDLGHKVGALTDLVIFCHTKRYFRPFRSGAIRAGLRRSAIVHAETYKEVVDALEGELSRGVVLLIKGPDNKRFERIILALKGEDVRCSATSCDLKLPLSCTGCPLVGVDTTTIKNVILNRLVEHKVTMD